MRVTDESIARVPRITSDVLDERHWDTLQQKHRELLESIRDAVVGTERIVAFDLNMIELGDAIGIPGNNRVSIKNFPEQHILIHNHADNNTFSFNDFESFVKRPSRLSIQAVGNGGAVFVLDKLPGYDAAGAIHKYLATIDQVEEAMLQGLGNSKIMDAIEQFYRSLTENGFTYRRWI